MPIFKRQTKKGEVAAKAAAVAPKKKVVVNAPAKKAAGRATEKKTNTSAKKVTAKKAATAKVSKRVTQSRDAYKILLRPLVTEKSSDGAQEGVYYFEVAPSADKIEIRDAIKALYGVIPRRVNVINVKGKRVRFGRVNGKRKNWRKAMVYLKKGDHIQIYEGV